MVVGTYSTRQNALTLNLPFSFRLRYKSSRSSVQVDDGYHQKATVLGRDFREQKDSLAVDSSVSLEEAALA
jgi:hypothetical protein